MGLDDEMLGTISMLHGGMVGALLVLVKTLEEAGAITSAHYEGNLRMYAGTLAATQPSGIAHILIDIANQIGEPFNEGNA